MDKPWGSRDWTPSRSVLNLDRILMEVYYGF